ncbi:MAG: Mut7-C RNAse domain-containing protein [Chloroflexota bacterium]
MAYKTACFHFFGSLNDLLPADKRQVDFEIEFQGDQSVKHLFESCGVPHTEVGRLTANGAPVDQKYIVQDGDRIEVHPPVLPIAYETGPEARFVLDNHLGKLAVYLRLLGFDVAYRNNFQDEELAQVSSRERRILLTRDRRLLMRSLVTQGYSVRALEPRQQVIEILNRYGLYPAITPFGRCVHCNALLQSAPKEEVLERLEPLTRLYFDEFQRCPACGQVYWQGSHFEHMQEFIAGLRQGAEEPGS